MKTIARFLILPALCVLAFGCKGEPDPVQEALGAYILQGREGTFRLYHIEKIDSTTFRTEFERREKVFDLKLQQETKLYNDYTAQRMAKNAARHRDAIRRTFEVTQGLDSLKHIMEPRLDEVAYYDYVFSGRVETDSQYTDFQDTYVSITPALEVIAMTRERKDLHKSGGRAIPGYLQMLGRDAEEEE